METQPEFGLKLRSGHTLMSLGYQIVLDWSPQESVMKNTDDKMDGKNASWHR